MGEIWKIIDFKPGGLFLTRRSGTLRRAGGGNYGQRLDYGATHIGANNYLPFSTGSQGLLRAGLIPGAIPTDRFIRFK